MIKKSVNKLETWFGNLPIRSKLLVVSIMLVLIPICVLTLFYDYYMQSIIENNTQSYLKETVRQMSTNLDERIDDVNNTMYEISTDTNIQDNIVLLQRREISEVERLRLENDTRDLIIHYGIKIGELKEIKIVLPDNTEIDYKSVPESYRDSIPKDMVSSYKGKTMWGRASHEDVIPVYKQINSLKSQKPLGIICAYLECDYLYSMIDNTDITGADEYYIVDADGESVKDNKAVTMKYDYGLFRQSLSNNNWALVCLKNHNPSVEQLSIMHTITLVIFCIILLLMFIMCVLISNTISRPIVGLTKYMKKFSEGQFNMTVPAKYNDEVGMLRQHFNEMTENTQKLLTRIVEEEKLRQEAQIKALQMQINPHFFYNTLDTINWMAQMHGEKEITAVTQSFANLMRFSLRPDSVISFEEELESVDNYMIIQSYRYGDALSLDKDIEEDVIYENTPKHILLPIIENAVEHGLGSKEDNKKIIIRGKIRDKRIIIDIFDNGCGMSMERVSKLLTVESEPFKEKRHNSIGLKNVYMRLKLIYGEEAGMEISSKVDTGTLVSVYLPITDNHNMEE